MKSSATSKSDSSKNPKQIGGESNEDEKTVGAVQISGSKVKINVDGNNPRTLGSTNKAFQLGFITQLINMSSKGPEADEDAASCAIAIINGIDPQNELEAMLGAQMVAIHNASMTMARRLAHVDTLQQQDSAERALNKLTRTYALQLQALSKYRSGGKQQVIVKHVHVNEGGQAIVGNVETGGAGETKR